MKKRVLSIIMMAAMSVSSFMSCSSDTDNLPTEDGSTGAVTVSFGLETSASSRAISQSTAKPVTGWNNVNQLMMLFVDGSDMVKAARVIKVPDVTTMEKHDVLLSNVPAGSFKAYLIANYNESNITRPNGGAAWNEGNVVGQNINALTLNLVANSDFTPVSTESIASGFKSPSEIFMDSKQVTIIADQTSSSIDFTLTRIVSIFRVRVDQSQNGNNVVNFKEANADIRIRKIAKSFNPKSLVPANVIATDLIYDKGIALFNDAEPTSGYSNGQILDAENNISLWSDLLIFPGGSATEGSKKMDLVISGLAPVGYIPLGQTAGLTTATLVYWNGQVQANVLSNNILEVNCILKQSGSVVVPEVGSYGNLDIDVNIAEWGNISSTNIEM